MTHGGKRSGSGRPASAGEPGRSVSLRLSPAVEAELTAALRDGETLSDLLRDGGLQLARRRREP